MQAVDRLYANNGWTLQWVHGPQTVVMRHGSGDGRTCASSSFNGSTVLRPWLCMARAQAMAQWQKLQWVHGPQTVVMWSNGEVAAVTHRLQWVHGPQTVVMLLIRLALSLGGADASMGPRSSDRGYAVAAQVRQDRPIRFNGSTVLRPWLWCLPTRSSASFQGFNGSTVLRPWL